MDSRIERAANILGREVREEDRGSVASLREFPAALRNDVKTIARSSTVLALAFIRFYAEDATLGEAVRFMEEVVAEDGPPVGDD